MLFTVQQLIADRPVPTTVRPGQTGLDALNLMIAHDYSQLPVVDGASRLVGLVTGDSLLRAANNLGVLPKDLRVKDAQLKPRTASVDSDVFDLLDDLKAAAAVLIVDGAQQLVGIVTDYDAMEFLRRRAEDMMLVEDIETSLKDHIYAAFTTDGHVDDHALTAVVVEVADSRRKQVETFRKALNHYLSLSGNGPGAKPDSALVEKVVSRHYPDQEGDISLDRLTMAQFVDVLLKGAPTYIGRVFPIGLEAVRTLLDPVREIRNTLFHFRDAITPPQRERLRYCAQWLAQAGASFQIAAEGTASGEGTVSGAATLLASAGGVDTVVDEKAAPRSTPVGEHVSPDGPVTPPLLREHESEPSRITAVGAMRVADYAKLTAHLKEQQAERKVVSMAFGEIERVIDGSLPDAARLHRSWWSNDASTFAYARAWVDAGWRVTADMADEVATFTRDRA